VAVVRDLHLNRGEEADMCSREKGFEFAAETVKQQIALATALATLAATFASDLFQGVTFIQRAVLIVGTGAMFGSVLIGVFALQALAWAVAGTKDTIFSHMPSAVLAIGQSALFIFGLAMLLVFAVWAGTNPPLAAASLPPPNATP
jgi:hypothetical protein